MKPPLFVRDLTAGEEAALRRGLRSADAFVLRRSQILLARAAGQRPSRIAGTLGCATRTVRDAIRAVHARGAEALTARPEVPKTTRPAWPRTRDDDPKGLRHQSPRTPGKPTSLWTLGLVAAVCHEEGWAARVLSPESIRRILDRRGVGRKRAKHRITSPDPEYAKKKRRGTA